MNLLWILELQISRISARQHYNINLLDFSNLEDPEATFP